MNPFKPGTKSYENFERLSPEQKQALLQPQGGTPPSLADMAKRKLLDKGFDMAKGAAATQLGSLFGGSGAVAPMATQITASAPSMMLPGYGAAIAPSATGATGGAAAGAGMSTLGTAASGAAAVAAPLVLGSLIDKLFFKEKPKRAFNAEEVATDIEGNTLNHLNRQIPGYKDMSLEARKPLLEDLYKSQVLVLPGYGDKEGVTQKRTPEYLNFARFMRRPGEDMSRDGGSKWYDAASGVLPTEDEINKAHWLKDSKKQDLLGALAAIKGVSSPSREVVAMPRGGLDNLMGLPPGGLEAINQNEKIKNALKNVIPY